jgi:enediyne polyketide synthase
MTERIAVVGLACRYPDAAGPARLWETVMARRVAFRRLPAGRLPLAEYGGDGADETYVTHAGLLTGWQFDRSAFRVAGPTFRAADTTHWLALETSALALADAGFPDGDGLDRGRTGVILGNTLTGEFSRAAALRTRWPYVRRAVEAALAGAPLERADRAAVLDEVERRYKEPFPVPSEETLAGALSNTIAGRVCNHFDLHGTGYTVDGACASSLLAVAHAAAALTAGDLDVALAGGVDLSLDPFELVGFARAGALAHGDMRVYDRRPTGFLPGEGCGIVVLCRESYARRHDLRAYGFVLGWGTSADGNGGLIRPEPAGQVLALRRAYRRAGLEAARVRMVEGHGTGTEVGDLAEMRALREVRGFGGQPAALSSVKANIGHTKAAAGVAGLLKAVLAVHHGVLPPATGCPEPHPMLTEPGAPLEILDEARRWPPGPRYAAVSAMGFGGINTHIVVRDAEDSTRPLTARRPGRAEPRVRVEAEPRVRAEAEPRVRAEAERRLAVRPPSHEVVVCTADDRAALARRLVALRDAGPLSRADLTDLAATLARGEPPDAPLRFAAGLAGPDDLAPACAVALAALDAGRTVVVDPRRGVFLADRRLRVGLLFPGQAAPCYPDAGALGDLLGDLPPGYPDAAVPGGPAGVPGTEVAQPAILRATLAGLRWLDRLGVVADEAVGHSLGEVAALVWAEMLDEASAQRLVRVRGAAMAAADPAAGAMATVGADPETVARLLAGTGVVVAADNGDRRLVISGDRAEVGRVLERAAADDIGVSWLPVRHAFHSPAMTAAAGPLAEVAASVPWRAARRRHLSTVTGARYAGEDPVELLTRQLTAPVRFREALSRCRADLLVETGPGHGLSALAGIPAVSLDAGSPSAHGVATSTAALFAAGRCATVEPYFARRHTRRLPADRPLVFLTNPCERATNPCERAVPPAATSSPARDAAPLAGGAGSPPAANEGGDPLTATIAAVAAAGEFDESAVAPDTRLLADLHLSSLVVGQLAAALAARLGRSMPAAPLMLATATVRELADTVAALPEAGAADAPAAGVAGWVRAFAEQRLPEPAPGGPDVPRTWEIVGGLAGNPLAGAIRAAFADEPGGTPTRLLALSSGPAATPWPDVLDALRRCHDDRMPLVVVHHDDVGGAVARSLVAERPDVPVLAVDVPADPAGITAAAAECRRPFTGYTEVVRHGRRAVPVLAPLPLPAGPGRIPLTAGEVCVVSGGAKGIGAECVVALAAATGARMVLLGRSPAGDETVRATLARVTATGAPVAYRQADVTDADAVRATLAEVRREHGPVRAILHAAGLNVPARIPDLTVAAITAALAAKVDGFDHLLDAVDRSELRLVVAFGSVIARVGLAGEAHYAMANERLVRRCTRLAAAEPGVRWLAVQWSAWTDAGMGVSLGVLDNLIRRGLGPIPPRDGTALLLRLLAAPDLPPALVVAGRLPAGPTLRWRDRDRPAGRFVAEPLSWTPEVEMVAAADLSAGTDPYLPDHRVDGATLLPAVVGLEAMAQAGAAVTDGPPVLADVAFRHPVTVPDRQRRTVRVAALRGEDGVAEVVLRSAETGFATDHFRAWYGGTPADPGAVRLPPTGPPLAAAHLYGPLFFHGPRLRRVAGYHAIAARRCVGLVDADPHARCFGDFVDSRLLLGDPAARDAVLHLLQVCVPDRRVLPVAAGRITPYRPFAGRLVVHAVQRAESADEYRFDVLVTDPAGEPVERWCDLVLRAVGPVAPVPWPIEVAGARLARRLADSHPKWEVDLAVSRAANRSADVAGWLTGGGPDEVSATRLGDHLLVAARPGPVGVDWEAVRSTPPPLGPGDAALARELGRRGAADPGAAGYRIWTCRETLRKLGQPPAVPLLVGDEPDTLQSGSCTLVSTVMATTAGTVAVCVGVG